MLDTREVPPSCAPDLYRRVDELAAAGGIEPPQVLVARMETPNALDLGGPTDGDVGLDARLFRLLSAPEPDAIVAHEPGHLRNRDGLVQTIGASTVHTVAGLLLLALLPLTLLVAGSARAVAYPRRDSYARMRATTARAHAAVTGVAVLLLFVSTLALRAHSRRREPRPTTTQQRSRATRGRSPPHSGRSSRRPCHPAGFPRCTSTATRRGP